MKSSLDSEFEDLFKIIKTYIFEGRISFNICFEIWSDDCLKGVLDLLIFSCKLLSTDDLTSSMNDSLIS